MRLPHARTLLANVMLNDDLMPLDRVKGLGPDHLIEQLMGYVEGLLRNAEPGESLTIERHDDEAAPWVLVYKDGTAPTHEDEDE